MNYNFWKSWKKVTKIEKRAIKAVEKARRLIIESVPKEKLHAIYIKGSFVRREMKEGSDVDIVPIVTENKYERSVFGVNGSNIEPSVVVPLSLVELKKNKLFTKPEFKPDLRAKPDTLLRWIGECRLIYGKLLDLKGLSIRADGIALKDEIWILLNGYIPLYEKGCIKFDLLLKEVFWLVALEQGVLGKKIQHSFRGIANSVSDIGHIAHYAMNLRNYPLKNREKDFVEKLKKHLSELKGTDFSTAD
jgi:predicted nucleotidyltransferase